MTDQCQHCKETSEHEKELMRFNFKASLLLGYAMVLIDDYAKVLPESKKGKIYWLVEAVNHLYYGTTSEIFNIGETG